VGNWTVKWFQSDKGHGFIITAFDVGSACSSDSLIAWQIDRLQIVRRLPLDDVEVGTFAHDAGSKRRTRRGSGAIAARFMASSQSVSGLVAHLR
jgi:hypothetical protein